MRRAVGSEKIAGGLEIMAALAAAGAFLSGFGILLLHLFEWFRFGSLSQQSILIFLMGNGIRPPKTSWAGVQRAMDWFMALPTEAMGPVALILLAFLLRMLTKGERRKSGAGVLPKN